MHEMSARFRWGRRLRPRHTGMSRPLDARLPSICAQAFAFGRMPLANEFFYAPLREDTARVGTFVSGHTLANPDIRNQLSRFAS